MTSGSGPAETEERLREVLDALATQVQPPPGAYERVQREWRRRARRRKLILAILAAVVFTSADAAGLWALNQGHDRPHVIVNTPLRPSAP